MSKFSAGDKVRVVSDSGQDSGSGLRLGDVIGKVFTVGSPSAYYEHVRYLIDDDGNHVFTGGVYDDNLELYVEPQKSKFKTGDKVRVKTNYDDYGVNAQYSICKPFQGKTLTLKTVMRDYATFSDSGSKSFDENGIWLSNLEHVSDAETDKTAIDLANRFGYHAPDDEKRKNHEAIRDLHLALATMVVDRVPESRERALALTKIEESMFWSNAGIARA